MNTHADDGRARELDAVLALVRTRTAAVKRDVLERFVVRYFGQVDPEDLAERTPADLYGAALSHWNFARKREPGYARVRVFNPTIEEHGWQSTHTLVEIVNDDMPFLVDSVTMEVNRHGLTLHLIIHPLVAVLRDKHGMLADVAPEGAPDAIRESFIHVEVDRITDPARLAALATDVARVLEDVRLAVNDWKKMRDKLLEVVARDRCEPAADAAGGARRVQGVPVVACRRALHVPGLPLPRSRRGRRPGRPQDRAGIEPRLPARESRAERCDELLGVAAGGPCVRTLPRPPDCHEGQRTLHRAPARLPRLRRHQALRRRGQRLRRAPLSRPVHVDRVQREPGRNSAAAAQDGQRDCPRRRRARQPRGQGAAQHPRNAIRATSCSRRPRTNSCVRRWLSCTWASGSASGCSSGAIPSSAFSCASSTRRARATRPSCARSGRRS